MWSSPRMPFALSSDRPSLAPPGGRPLIVNVAMNIEVWPFDAPMPRGVLPPPHGKPSAPPDVPNWARAEYGLRAGMPRLLRLLGDRGIRVSALPNAAVADVYPALMDAILKAGWELVDHGRVQRSLRGEADEEAVILRSLARLRSMGPVRAWLGPGLGETDATPDLLRKHGIAFLHDWCVEDLPVRMHSAHGPMLAMPCAFALNDVPIYVIGQAGSEEWERRVDATVEVLAAEGQPRVMTLALHPHVIGVPHLFLRLAGTIDRLAARSDTVFMTSSETGDRFVAADGTGGVAVAGGPPA